MMRSIQKFCKLTRGINKIGTINRDVFKLSPLVLAYSFSKNEKYSEETLKKLKKEAKEFAKAEVLVEDNQDIVVLEMKKNEDWKKFVLESTKPVIILCYAHWSKQSTELSSILEPKIRSYKGAIKIVKLNIDIFPQIATALKVKTVPTVFLISGGNAIDGFLGVPDNNVLNHFYSTIDKLCGLEIEEQDMNKSLQDAKDSIAKGAFDDAATPLNKILENEKWTNKYGGQAYAMLSYISIKKGNREAAVECIKEISLKFSDEEKTDEVQFYLKKVHEILEHEKAANEQNPRILELEAELQRSPKDLNLRYTIAELYFGCGNFEKSINHLLDLMKIDRNWEEKKANNLIIKIFEKLGSSDKMVIDARKKMQRMLY